MIETIFNEEKEQMKMIINSNAIIQNISYKLAHDLNTISFFEKLIDNIKEYDSMERMDKYHFDKDFVEIRSVLHLLYRSLRANSMTQDKDAEKIVKCCNIFPDNIGKRIIMFISYIPILDLFHEKHQYLTYFGKKIDLEASMMGETYLEHQEDRLFGKSVFNPKFPSEDDFIDYKLRNRFVDKLEEEYNGGRKEEIESALSLLLETYNTNASREEVSILIGSTYWDEKKQVRSAQSKAFADAIMAMSKAFEQKEKGEDSNE